MQTQHFSVSAPESFCNTELGGPGCLRCTGLSTTVASDTLLHIRGNIVWNFATQADGATPLGFDWSGGCQAGSTCNETWVRATNAINDPSVKPQLFNPAGGDFRQAHCRRQSWLVCCFACLLVPWQPLLSVSCLSAA